MISQPTEKGGDFLIMERPIGNQPQKPGAIDRGAFDTIETQTSPPDIRSLMETHGIRPSPNPAETRAQLDEMPCMDG